MIGWLMALSGVTGLGGPFLAANQFSVSEWDLHEVEGVSLAKLLDAVDETPERVNGFGDSGRFLERWSPLSWKAEVFHKARQFSELETDKSLKDIQGRLTVASCDPCPGVGRGVFGSRRQRPQFKY